MRACVLSIVLAMLPSTAGLAVVASRRRRLTGSEPPRRWRRHLNARLAAAPPTAECEGAIPMIEVERKYAASEPEDLRTRVLAAGGKELGEGAPPPPSPPRRHCAATAAAVTFTTITNTAIHVQFPTKLLLRRRFRRLPSPARFVDSYWDTPACALASGDCWLRRRQQNWELKVPAGAAARSGGERTSFTEIEGAAAVARALTDKALVPKSSGGSDEDGFEAVLREAGFEPFAEIETVRTKFHVPLEAGSGSDGCLVDADVACSRLQPGWSHSVVEIEVLCATQVRTSHSATASARAGRV